MKPLLRTLTFGLFMPLIWSAPASAGNVTPQILNTKCTVEGTTVRLKKVTYTCTKTGKTLRWKTASAGAATTTTTLPYGYPFTLPTQYVQGGTKADVAVSRTTVKRGDAIAVAITINAVMQGETTELDYNSTLQELIDNCKSSIGKGNEFSSPVAGWSTSVQVSLAGTTVTAGGLTQLMLRGNVPTACGSTLLPPSSSGRPRLGITRISVYQPVQLS
ncbi:MAG: hypothetical protein ACKPCO_03345, partial [Actinomycetota bacterium]